MNIENRNIYAIVVSNMPILYSKYKEDDVLFYIDKIKEKYVKYLDSLPKRKVEKYNIEDKLQSLIINQSEAYDYIWDWLENAASPEYYKIAHQRTAKKKQEMINKIGKDIYNHEWWKEMRLRIKKRDRFTCKECGSKYYLHVHHTKYRHISNDKKDLLTLCKFCHAKKHPINGAKMLKEIKWEH